MLGVVELSLRLRRPADLDALLVLLQQVHEQDGYPVRAEAVSAAWLTAAAKPGQPTLPELGGWVAVDGARVVGHVGLHPAAGPCLPLWEAVAPSASLAVVSRLFTDRSVQGAGTDLLSYAVGEAGAIGRRPVLEVDAEGQAYSFYVRRGWRDVGRTPQQWGHRLVDSAAMVLGA